MARLVAVCREGEEDYPFLSRQIPLYIDDTLTVCMPFRVWNNEKDVYDECDVIIVIISTHRWHVSCFGGKYIMDYLPTRQS